MLARMLCVHRSLVSGVALFGALFLVGCRSDETIARESFAHEFSCPNERITVTPRKDLVGADLAIRQEAAPKDIAADPGRLDIWQKEAARRRADYDGSSVIQVRGCEKELLYICGDLRVSVGATRHVCQRASYPPGS